MVGLGTWQFGSREWGYGEAYARDVAPALIRRAVELGITMIDTAEIYGPAHSERIIGEVLPQLPEEARTGLTVATKFMPVAPLEQFVAWQAAGSRRRLGMDALDLYYAHWPNPFVSPRRVMQAVRPLREAGLVRNVGVSNYSLGAWQAAERALKAPVVANQVRFSLLSPAPAETLVPWAAAKGRVVVAYSPLAQGLLSGPRDDEAAAAARGAADADAAADAAPPQPSELRRRRLLSSGRLPVDPETVRGALEDIGRAHGATPAQVALAWVIGHPNTIAIPGARTVRQLEQNAEAADLILADAEMAQLTDLVRPAL